MYAMCHVSHDMIIHTCILSAMLCCLQFESLAGFSAVVDRLGQFSEVMDDQRTPATASLAAATASSTTATAAETAAAATAVAATAAAASSSKDALVSMPGDGALASTSSMEDGPGITLVWPDAVSSSPASSASSAPVLELRDISVVTPRGHVPLVERLNVSVHAGDALLLMGPSGAGGCSACMHTCCSWRLALMWH